MAPCHAGPHFRLDFRLQQADGLVERHVFRRLEIYADGAVAVDAHQLRRSHRLPQFVQFADRLHAGARRDDRQLGEFLR